MQTLHTIQAIRNQLEHYRRDNKIIAFVPTMGNLHAGHLSLIKQARSQADIVVASIFVNPLQFGPQEDFERYPRTPQEDAMQLAEAEVDFLFMPSVDELYPKSLDEQTSIHVPKISDILCGAFRPGHFDGVATIVIKLFNIIQPHIAIFGEKDFQQLCIIQRCVDDLSLPIKIMGAPIMREADGLAMSSRNQYLSHTERQLAPELYKGLLLIEVSLINGNKDFLLLERNEKSRLETLGFEPDYVTILDSSKLDLATEETNEYIILVAARLGKTRLIDNLMVQHPALR